MKNIMKVQYEAIIFLLREHSIDIAQSDEFHVDNDKYAKFFIIYELDEIKSDNNAF